MLTETFWKEATKNWEQTFNPSAAAVPESAEEGREDAAARKLQENQKLSNSIF